MNDHGKGLIENFRWESRLPSSERRITYAMTPEELQKFAEMIIEECIALVGYYEYGNDGEAADFAGDAIKYHFGVE